MKKAHGTCQVARFAYSSENELTSGDFHRKIFNFAFLTAKIFSLSETELMKTNRLALFRANVFWHSICSIKEATPRKTYRKAGGAIINIPIQITFKNMLSSEAIEANIRDRAEKLESFYDKIMGCRVLVEAPHHHHRAGQRYHVRIDLTVPGREIIIKRAPRLITAKPLRFQKDANDLELEESREPSKYAVHDDILLAISDAFDAARRKLQDYARRERGVVKVHEGFPHGRVIKVFPEEGFGFLETLDGREIYFHEHSVLESGFGGLKVGTEVHFVEEAGERGPQASTVMPVKHHDMTR